MTTPTDHTAPPRAGAPENDFDFLLGTWDTESQPGEGAEGTALRGRWRAEKRQAGRIIVDDYAAFDPAGRTVRGFATLRTWSPTTDRWEMTFLAAGMPVLVDQFTGRRVGDELHLHATVKGALLAGSEAFVRFFEIHASGFRWEQSVRSDPSEAWRHVLSIRASRQ